MTTAKQTFRALVNDRLYYVDFGHTDSEGHRAVKIRAQYLGRHAVRTMIIWSYGRKTTPHITAIINAAIAMGDIV